MKYQLKTDYKKILADTITPVSIYLKIRDKYPNSILLESSDYHGNENSFSYICCNPIASITLIDGEIIESYPDNKTIVTKIDKSIRIEKRRSYIKGFITGVIASLIASGIWYIIEKGLI